MWLTWSVSARTLKNCATAGRPCLTAFNDEAYIAGLYLSHLQRYTLVMLCTIRLKLHWFDLLWTVANLFVKHVGNKSNQWSLSLTVHVRAKSRYLSVCSKVLSISTDAVAWWLHSTSSSVIICSAIWSIGCEAASRGPFALADIILFVSRQPSASCCQRWPNFSAIEQDFVNHTDKRFTDRKY